MHHLNTIIKINNPGYVQLRCGTLVKKPDPKKPMVFAMDIAEARLMALANSDRRTT